MHQVFKRTRVGRRGGDAWAAGGKRGDRSRMGAACACCMTGMLGKFVYGLTPAQAAAGSKSVPLACCAPTHRACSMHVRIIRECMHAVLPAPLQITGCRWNLHVAKVMKLGCPPSSHSQLGLGSSCRISYGRAGGGGGSWAAAPRGLPRPLEGAAGPPSRPSVTTGAGGAAGSGGLRSPRVPGASGASGAQSWTGHAPSLFISLTLGLPGRRQQDEVRSAAPAGPCGHHRSG